MNRPIFATIIATMLIAATANATPAEDTANDTAYCRAAVAEQMATKRAEDAQNQLARTAVSALTSVLLGGDIERTAIHTTRNSAYGQLNRSRVATYQKRALIKQCLAERKRDR